MCTQIRVFQVRMDAVAPAHQTDAEEFFGVHGNDFLSLSVCSCSSFSSTQR